MEDTFLYWVGREAKDMRGSLSVELVAAAAGVSPMTIRRFEGLVERKPVHSRDAERLVAVYVALCGEDTTIFDLYERALTAWRKSGRVPELPTGIEAFVQTVALRATEKSFEDLAEQHGPGGQQSEAGTGAAGRNRASRRGRA